MSVFFFFSPSGTSHTNNILIAGIFSLSFTIVILALYSSLSLSESDPYAARALNAAFAGACD